MRAKGTRIGARDTSPALDKFAVVIARQWLSLVALQSREEAVLGQLLALDDLAAKHLASSLMCWHSDVQIVLEYIFCECYAVFKISTFPVA